MDPDMEDLPTDSTSGVDFRIIKHPKVDMLIIQHHHGLEIKTFSRR